MGINRIVLFICFILTSLVTGFAQSGQLGTAYEIGNVKVVGAEHSDENSIIAVSGFRVGDKIRIPGNDVQRAIRALWDLQLFENVEIRKKDAVADVIVLEIQVTERPRLTRYDFEGVKKSRKSDVEGRVKPFLLKGGIITEANKLNVKNAVERFYQTKGYLDTKATIQEIKDPNLVNGVQIKIKVDKGKRVKIKNIVFSGNDNVKSRKLRNKMKETKRKSKIFKKSKFVEKDYEADKKAIITYYNNIGYRDAKIVGDSIWREGKDLMVKINIDEGRRFYFRNVTFKGNSIYNDDVLNNVLGIEYGDPYNKELLQNRLSFAQDGRDISSLYMDNGYLFFNAQSIEKSIVGDSIDIEIRMFEGPQAIIDKIIITGNTRTNEHVIRRELRTLPGKKFSRSDIIRSQREIINLGYFNPENLGVNPVPNYQRGTVDIKYDVTEKSNDQLELSAGWGGPGRGVIGTLGVTFNNFSINNIFKKEAWRPLPQGDGQKLSIRAQTNGRFYQSYNLSFTEPWLGGKKPTSFTTGLFYSRVTSGITNSTNFGSLDMLGASVSIGTRLQFPDDYFVSSTALSLQSYKLTNYGNGGFTFQKGTDPLLLILDGRYNNFSLKQTIARNSVNNPLFPTSGSKVSLSIALTPPYSLFKGKIADYGGLETEEERRQWASENLKWAEYHKWRLDVEWYSKLVGKLTLKVGGKFGFLGSYNEENLGITPFERYELGGDGLSNQFAGIAGRDILALRGYETSHIAANSNGGASVFTKLSVELRYPVTLNPNATIYALAFFDGGNAWDSFRDYNPLDLKRSVGVGARFFLPMFGLLGVDYGIGFDKNGLIETGAKWSDYAKMSLILGFEPE